MTGLFNGIGIILAIFLFLLLFMPVVIVLCLADIRPLRRMKKAAYYVALACIYLASCALTLVIVKNVPHITYLYWLATAVLVMGFILFIVKSRRKK